MALALVVSALALVSILFIVVLGLVLIALGLVIPVSIALGLVDLVLAADSGVGSEADSEAGSVDVQDFVVVVLGFVEVAQVFAAVVLGLAVAVALVHVQFVQVVAVLSDAVEPTAPLA